MRCFPILLFLISPPAYCGLDEFTGLWGVYGVAVNPNFISSNVEYNYSRVNLGTTYVTQDSYAMSPSATLGSVELDLAYFYKHRKTLFGWSLDLRASPFQSHLSSSVVPKKTEQISFSNNVGAYSMTTTVAGAIDGALGFEVAQMLNKKMLGYLKLSGHALFTQVTTRSHGLN